MWRNGTCDQKMLVDITDVTEMLEKLRTKTMPKISSQRASFAHMLSNPSAPYTGPTGVWAYRGQNPPKHREKRVSGSKTWRRTEQAKAKFDPGVGARERPREHPRGLIFPVLCLSRTPYKSSHEASHEGVHRSAHEKCPPKWSGFLCHGIILATGCCCCSESQISM